MNKNSVDFLKREAWNSPSKVAFRNLGKVGDTVSVRYYDSKGWSPDDYRWHHGSNEIHENQAIGLLIELTLREQEEARALREVKLYTFEGGYTVKRETGRVYLPKNNGIGVDGMGKWVLRDTAGNAVDMDKYHDDLLERHEKLIGELISKDYE
jgi:hypothetical protein